MAMPTIVFGTQENNCILPSIALHKSIEFVYSALSQYNTMQVKSSIEDTVYSSEPIPHGILELSNNDQVMPRLYTSILFFFRTANVNINEENSETNQNPAESTALACLLKASLSEALTVFYPCSTGRYREKQNGALELVFSKEYGHGVPFYEIWVDSELESYGPQFQPHPDFAQFVPEIDPMATISEIPIFLAQITHFQDGGLCLGLRLHHNIADGFSTGHFINSWAQISKAKAYGNPVRIALAPHIDRSLLIKANQVNFVASEHPEYQTHMPVLPTKFPAMTSKIFSYTPSDIDALKEKANTGSSSVHSGFESLAAHLWRSVILSRGIPSTEEVRLGMAVDGRKRFNPPLPDGYFGNVNFYGYATAKAGDLIDNPLSYTADLIKNAIAKVSDGHMRSAIDWIGKQESPKSIFAVFCRPFVDLAITSWSRFPFYEVDFGWGKPSFVRIPVSGFDGLIILLPSPLGPGHVDALIGFQVENAEKLEHFLKEA